MCFLQFGTIAAYPMATSRMGVTMPKNQSRLDRLRYRYFLNMIAITCHRKRDTHEELSVADANADSA